MDSLLGRSDSVRTSAAMGARVLADAKRAFGDIADEAVLERITRDAVDELCRGSIKVTTFVPVLALRRVRDLIEAGPAARETASEA